MRFCFALCAGVVLVGGCGGKTAIDNGSTSSSTSGAGSCAHDAAGANFTFHVANAGSRQLRIATGCGSSLPILLDSASGPLPISPGQVDFCEFPCDLVFKGQTNNGCSDCGPGTTILLPPGKTADIAWDRRVYSKYTVPQSCSGSATGNECALGKLAGAATKSGTIAICSDMMSGFDGACPDDKAEKNAFAIDLAKSAVTITVK